MKKSFLIFLFLLILKLNSFSQTKNKLIGEWEIVNYHYSFPSDSINPWILKTNNNNAWGKTKIIFSDSSFSVKQNEMEPLYPDSSHREETVYIMSEFINGNYILSKDKLMLFYRPDTITIKDTFEINFLSDTLYLKSL